MPAFSLHTVRWISSCLCTLSSCVLVVACSVSPPNASPPPEADSTGQTALRLNWSANVVGRIGTDPGKREQLLSQVVAMYVDSVDHVWILDVRSAELRTFDTLGNYVGKVGGIGDGPGELRQPIGMCWRAGGRHIIVDGRGRKFELLSNSMTPVGRIARTTGIANVPWEGGCSPDGRHIYELRRTTAPDQAASLTELLLGASAAEPTGRYVRVPDLTGTTSTHIKVRYENGIFMVPHPFAHRSHWRFDGDSGVWIVHSGTYEAVNVTMSGDTIHRFKRDYSPASVTEAEVAALLQSLRDLRVDPELGGQLPMAADSITVPERRPAFYSFVVDDGGFLWFATDPNGMHWDVTNPDGTAIGTLSLTDALDLGVPPQIVGHWFLGVTRDQWLAQSVVVYRVSR